jgi:hypothetical protein
MARRIPLAATLAVTAAAVAASATSFDTRFVSLVAVADPVWPAIVRGLPSESKTSLLPVGAAEVGCGWLPALRGVGCFPALWPWLVSVFRYDRTSAWLRLHTAPQARLTLASLGADLDGCVTASGLPGEPLLGASQVRLTRTPRLALERAAWVDAAAVFHRANSPLIQGEGYDGEDADAVGSSQGGLAGSGGAGVRGESLYLAGMLRPGGSAGAAAGLVYPTDTLLAAVSRHPSLTVLRDLLQATCYCAPRWWTVANATCLAWLCGVMERSVVTALGEGGAGV